MATKNWHELSTTQRRLIVVGTAMHAVLATAALRDLRHRPREQVRGPKPLWGLWASLNLTGSVGYFLIGRRRR